MTLSETIRKCYYEENMTFGEIMSAYKVTYQVVLKAIKEGPLQALFFLRWINKFYNEVTYKQLYLIRRKGNANR